MKLSLAWIFDHIDADWHKQSPEKIIELFNKRTAEVESFHTIAHDMSSFFMATPTDGGELFIAELNQTITLPARTKTATDVPGAWLVKKEGNNFRWATPIDFGGDKGSPLAAFSVSKNDLMGNWRTQWQAHDVIMEVDNKSITHRPDMWGHRGFAREIAAYMQLPLKPQATLLKNIPTVPFHRATSKPTATNPFTIDNQDVDGCKHFSGLYFPSVSVPACSIRVASRLLNMGANPINGLIDMTNYVMNDWTQPVHAYDADKLNGKKIIIRKANDQEALSLLGQTTLSMTTSDIIITDAHNPVGLGGIKGGLDSGVSNTTQKIFLEAATFEASTIRRTAQRHKIRTDASARFEKTLNPEMTIEVLQRFAKLLEEHGIEACHADEIVWVGSELKKSTITLSHNFIQQRMGISLQEDDVINLLTPLEFGIELSKDESGSTIYTVTVPPFRAAKDIKIKEDILEEIVRCYGFENIPLVTPTITRSPFLMHATTRVRTLKRFFATVASMIEQQNYSLCDEQFITSLGVKINEIVSLVNPISENHYRMITSLIPGLLKNISDNHIHHDALSFFEWGRVWKQNNETVETKSVAGVFFKKRAIVDFYDCKAIITHMFHALGFDTSKLTWEKATQSDAWFTHHQTAIIRYEQTVVGTAGMASSIIMDKLGIDAPSSAFIFELDGSFLLSAATSNIHYNPISKFQDTFVDISLMVPLTVTTHTLVQATQKIDSLVKRVDLIDFFEKEEWTDARAITIRLWLEHHEKTLQKTDIDTVWSKATEALSTLGAKVRT